MDNSLSEILDRYQVTAKWTKARNACYGLFTAGNGHEGEFMDRMRVLQIIILNIQKKFMLTGIVPAVLEVCKIEQDPRLQMQFLAAGYELVAGNDYNSELYQFLSKQTGIKKDGDLLWRFYINLMPCAGMVTKMPGIRDLTIRPCRIQDDIGNGPGQAIHKSFKAIEI